MPKPSRRCPPHLKARQGLLAMIERLTAAGIDRLPGERQLTGDLGVSLTTVKKAIRQLVGEDRLVTAPRDGHFIRAKRGEVDIGIILGEAGVSTFVRDPEALAGALTALHRHGCLGRMLQVRDPADAVRILAQYRIDGCLWFMPRPALAAGIARAVRAAPVPVAVTMLERLPEGIDLGGSLFTLDHEGNGRQRAEWLLARGHRRLALIADDRSPAYEGFAAALAQHGIDADPSLVIPDIRAIPQRLPPLLGAGGVTAIIAEGGPDRLQAVFAAIDGHPWAERGELLIDSIGARRQEELRRRHPLVRIAAVCHSAEQEVGVRAAESLVAAIRERRPLAGCRCRARILPLDAVDPR